MECLHNATIINLDYWLNKYISVANQLTSLDISFDRFSGIKTVPGLTGCSLSHKAVLQQINDRQRQHCMILEDDVQFLYDSNTVKEHFSCIERHLNRVEWDVLYLGFTPNSGCGCIVPGKLYKIKRGYGAYGYIVNRKIIPFIISLLPNDNQTIHKFSGQIIDNALYRIVQRRKKCYFSPICTVSDGWSNTWNKYRRPSNKIMRRLKKHCPGFDQYYKEHQCQ